MKRKVLFLAANPRQTAQLRLDQEIRNVTSKIRAADYRDSLELLSAWAVRPDDLQQLLLQHQPHIVHFSGHGSVSEEITLEDDSGNPKRVSKEALLVLFRALADENIRLVVLNSCHSKPQAEAITQVVDCAIGMSRAIGDEAAILFSASFYRALGFGRSIGKAFELGRASLVLENIREEATPELLVRSGIDAKQLFIVGSDDEPTSATSVLFSSITASKQFPFWNGGGVIRSTAKSEPDQASPYPPFPFIREHFDYHFHGRLHEGADPVFDITIMNRGDDPLLVTEVGAQLVALSYPPPAAGSMPGAVKVKSLDTYTVTIPRSWHELVQREIDSRKPSDVADDYWWTSFVLDELDEFAFTHLPDPVYVQPDAPFRFGLHLDRYGERAPAQCVIRVILKANDGTFCSPEIYMNGYV